MRLKWPCNFYYKVNHLAGGLGFGCCDNFRDKLPAAISQIISSLRDSLGVIQKFPVLCRAIA